MQGKILSRIENRKSDAAACLMTSSLLLGERAFEVSRRSLFGNCELFIDRPDLALQPYRVQSRVSSSEFGIFLGALEGREIEITDENATFLKSLCDEFRFSAFQEKIAAFIAQTSGIDRECRREIEFLKEQNLQQSRSLVILEGIVKAQEERIRV